jgi:hypothetical protein
LRQAEASALEVLLLKLSLKGLPLFARLGVMPDEAAYEEGRATG